MNFNITVPNMEVLYKSKYTVAPSAVYVSDNMTGKMSGIPVISTTMQLNPICRERPKIENSICQHCYAMRQTACYKSLERRLEENYWLLTTVNIPKEVLPRFKRTVAIVRFEAFGGLATAIQARNYLNICRVNPHVTFGLWTKNGHILDEVIKEDGKPENLKIILSSMTLNWPTSVNGREYIDKVFTVYDKDHIDGAEGFKCAGKDCASCGHCYLDNGAFVKELLK